MTWIDLPLLDNAAAYIAGWHRIRNSSAANVVRAAGDAERAVEWVVGKIG
jgi:antirestriction protein ArdC